MAKVSCPDCFCSVIHPSHDYVDDLKLIDVVGAKFLQVSCIRFWTPC